MSEAKHVKLVNLTPHTITIFKENGEVVELPPSGQIVRVKVVQEPAGEINGIPVVRSGFGEVEGLPPPKPGVVYVVSSLVAQAVARLGREDVVAPDTTGVSAVRDEEGRIIGVRRFQKFL